MLILPHPEDCQNHNFSTSDIRNYTDGNRISLVFSFYFQVLNLLGFICITVSYGAISSRGSWFNTVAMGGFWFTGILLALYLFHVIEKFYRIPWLKIVSVF